MTVITAQTALSPTTPNPVVRNLLCPIKPISLVLSIVAWRPNKSSKRRLVACGVFFADVIRHVVLSSAVVSLEAARFVFASFRKELDDRVEYAKVSPFFFSLSLFCSFAGLRVSTVVYARIQSSSDDVGVLLVFFSCQFLIFRILVVYVFVSCTRQQRASVVSSCT